MYQTLATQTSIRLLDIEPGRKRDLLRCSLRHVDLVTDPQYEAISYVWGESCVTRTIICCAQPVQVTPNLCEALERIRQHEKVRTVWVDGLCINQSDFAERSSQVQLMRNIYTKAKTVLIWLGSDYDQMASHTFSVCCRIADIVKHDTGPSTHIQQLLGGIDERSDWLWQCLARLVSCPWWSRVWIVQELVLARAALVMWGDREISWNRLRLAIEWLQTSNVRNPLTPWSLDRMNRLSLLSKTYSVEARIISMVYLAKSQGCSDHRDRIYGLLGVEMQDLSARDNDIQVATTDYNKSVHHVYWDFALAAVKNSVTRRIFGDFLQISQHRKSLQPWCEGHLPSWVPSWHIYETQNFPLGLRWMSIPALCEEDYQLKQHTPQGPVPPGHGGRPSILSTRAVLVDTICAISPWLFEANVSTLADVVANFWIEQLESIHKNAAANVRELLYELCESLAAYSNDLSPACVAMAMLWHSNVVSPPTNTNILDLNAALESIHDTQRRERMQLCSCNTLLHNSRIWYPARQALRLKRLMQTKSGRIGLCSAATSEGDQIFLLPKVGCPMVLRKQGDFHQLVGGSYLPALQGSSDTSLNQVVRDNESRIIELK